MSGLDTTKPSKVFKDLCTDNGMETIPFNYNFEGDLKLESSDSFCWPTLDYTSYTCVHVRGWVGACGVGACGVNRVIMYMVR